MTVSQMGIIEKAEGCFFGRISQRYRTIPGWLLTRGLALSLLLVVGCRHAAKISGDAVSTDEVSFTIQPPSGDGDAWKLSERSASHLAWTNSKGSSAIVHFMCETDLATPLDALLRHLHIGMTDIEISALDTIQHAGRNALYERAFASVDGVRRYFSFLVLTKDECIYDLMLTGDPADQQALDATFKGMMDSFEVHSRPNWPKR